ncbi:hypothetical protein [Bacillus sp. OV166]|uniref:hypothetical protein n=1 Tax=Bacillus sp. OV166 TaxID=1882763 RepID=UPI0011551FFE|nr:hypothetical protein [Bacillus sp. OV166]
MLSNIDGKGNQHFASKGYGNLCDSFKAWEVPFKGSEANGTGTDEVSEGTGMIVRGIAMAALF